MDKNSIKKYAVWARRELISRVSQKALQYGVSEKEIVDANADTLNGHLLTANEKRQRQSLISRIKQIGYQQTMEEAAYTWFNRFSAIRFMEVNGYLPTHVRVFTDEQNAFKPQILAEAIHLELDGLNMDKVYELKDANKTDELYKYLLITQCNALSSILPKMFTRIEDYTALLFPDNLLREGSVIEQMIFMIPEEDWKDAVQIIGWLYQYYNAEPKDKVFENLKKNIKISKEDIPAATQLFTPDWIVRYMVENSLGRLWVEGHPNDALKASWKYYLEEAEQEPEVQAQLAEIRKEYSALKPEEIKVIDPCMGSGHILVYMFDVLVQIYESYGYNAREAAGLILQNNLYGLDIDDRAAQLAYFAVMMKARQYDRRIFSRGIQPHVYSIVESNGITTAPLHDMGLELTEDEYGEAVKQTIRLIDEMHDAKEYGSILNITPCDWDLLRRFAVPRCVSEGQITLDIHGEQEASARLQEIINVAEAMAQKYHAVVTNPPYMAPTEKQKPYLKKNYLDSKNDLAMVFVERGLNLCDKNGFSALINFPTWMFLSSYENLRKKMVRENTFVTMVYPGRGIFGSDFGTTCFVLNKQYINSYKGTYCKLFDAIGEVESVEVRESQYLYKKGLVYFNQNNFKKIPANPIAFWISDNMLKSFSEINIGDKSVSKAGIVSGNDDLFLRLWFEVSMPQITFDATNFNDKTAYKWVPINKGGAYRRYYGNYEYVLNIYDLWNSPEKVNVSVRRSEPEYYFKKAITWSSATMGSSSFRVTNKKTSSTAAPNLFFNNDEDMYLALAVLNSNISQYYLDLLNPTVSLNVTNVSSVPFLDFGERKERVIDLCKQNITLSKEDWDALETSWDYESSPLIRYNSNGRIATAYETWKNVCHDRFVKMKENEEELNKIITEVYGLSSEISKDVDGKSISIHTLYDDKDSMPEEMKGGYFTRTLKDEIVALISYAIGCMFGRYSLHKKGVQYAGGIWEMPNNNEIVDFDNIIPISDDEYFSDDIVAKFENFIKIAFGNEHLEENLLFISQALQGKGSPKEIIRDYFVNDFYKDHCTLYSGIVGRRPIYWLFDSGKKNGFKALIYMHRYQPDTIARMRTDYVHEQQSRYRTAIADLEQRINSASTGDRVKLSKKLQTLQDQANEIRVYEEKIHHLADQMIRIDLDDGVKVNYAKFEDVLAKIK